MTYKTIVIDYAPKTKAMAAAVEAKANEMAAEGYALVTMSITNSAKAILVFGADAQPVCCAEPMCDPELECCEAPESSTQPTCAPEPPAEENK